MIRLNVLTEKREWILARAARELLSLKRFEVTINGHLGAADIDYYLPYLLYNPERDRYKNKQAGFFTHLELGTDPVSQAKAKKFHSFKKKLDLNIAISKQTQEVLGLAHCRSVIRMGSQFSKPLTFGVVGRVHPSGRKNEQFVEALVARGFRVIAWGEGWPCEIVSRNVNDLESFYSKIDYLIVTSSIEGGPVPVLEALSLGVPVIAPNVGWCWDFPVIRYERGDFESLFNVIYGLTHIPSWEDWRRDHHLAFQSIL